MIYLVEERVEQVNQVTPLRDNDVVRVRCVTAVRWAMPLYSGIQRVRIDDGSLKTCSHGPGTPRRREARSKWCSAGRGTRADRAEGGKSAAIPSYFQLTR